MQTPNEIDRIVPLGAVLRPIRPLRVSVAFIESLRNDGVSERTIKRIERDQILNSDAVD